MSLLSQVGSLTGFPGEGRSPALRCTTRAGSWIFNLATPIRRSYGSKFRGGAYAGRLSLDWFRTASLGNIKDIQKAEEDWQPILFFHTWLKLRVREWSETQTISGPASVYSLVFGFVQFKQNKQTNKKGTVRKNGASCDLCWHSPFLPKVCALSCSGIWKLCVPTALLVGIIMKVIISCGPGLECGLLYLLLLMLCFFNF